MENACTSCSHNNCNLLVRLKDRYNNNAHTISGYLFERKQFKQTSFTTRIKTQPLSHND